MTRRLLSKDLLYQRNFPGPQSTAGKRQIPGAASERTRFTPDCLRYGGCFPVLGGSIKALQPSSVPHSVCLSLPHAHPRPHLTPNHLSPTPELPELRDFQVVSTLNNFQSAHTLPSEPSSTHRHHSIRL